MKHSSPLHQTGFTLIEIIIVIMLTSILAAMTASIIELPIRAYADSTRRAMLTDAAESALRRMQRDIHHALPNSIRISSDQSTLELLHLVDGGRYRAITDNTVTPPSGDILNFDIADSSFEVLGGFNNLSAINVGRDKVVIYPLDSLGNNAYAGDNVATISAINSNVLSFNAFQFPLRSPNQRFFIIDTPVTYRCDTSSSITNNKTLLRYSHYPIQTTQPLIPKIDPAIQANQIADCRFSFKSGSNIRSAVVTINLTLTDSAGESTTLIHQVHLDNQP